jgi:hypothetical protein
MFGLDELGDELFIMSASATVPAEDMSKEGYYDISGEVLGVLDDFVA